MIGRKYNFLPKAVAESHVFKKKKKSKFSKDQTQDFRDASGLSTDPSTSSASSEMLLMEGWMSGNHS